MTVLEVIQSATGYLDRHGVESPRLSAEHLLAHALGLRRLDLYLCFDRPLSDAERAPMRETIRQRAAGVPLQHLLGTWDFHGRTFRCDPRALIPRPETELLAEWVLEKFPKSDTDFSVLDVGTGTGVLALTLALERPGWQVTGSDLSPAALELAAENQQAVCGEAPCSVLWVEADLIPPGTSWNLIVSNPPYIPSGEISSLPREVLHDPVLALDGGADGLEIYRRLIPDAHDSLQPGGSLFLEMGTGQEECLTHLGREAGFQNIELRKDHNAIPRILYLGK